MSACPRWVRTELVARSSPLGNGAPFWAACSAGCALSPFRCAAWSRGGSRGWGGGWLAERLSREPWDLHGGGGQGARFPGSGFLPTRAGRAGSPPPPPEECSTPLCLSSPRAGPWGPPQPPLPFPGEPRRGRAGRLGSYPLPSQKEIPPRSPQALGSQNNPAGEGRLCGREARGAQGRAAVTAGASGDRGENPRP